MKKSPSSGKCLIRTYSILGGWGGGGCFIEFEWDREGGGVGWALIRSWALIRINTVRAQNMVRVIKAKII